MRNEEMTEVVAKEPFHIPDLPVFLLQLLLIFYDSRNLFVNGFELSWKLNFNNYSYLKCCHGVYCYVECCYGPMGYRVMWVVMGYIVMWNAVIFCIELCEMLLWGIESYRSQGCHSFKSSTRGTWFYNSLTQSIWINASMDYPINLEWNFRIIMKKDYRTWMEMCLLVSLVHIRLLEMRF